MAGMQRATAVRRGAEPLESEDSISRLLVLRPLLQMQHCLATKAWQRCRVQRPRRLRAICRQPCADVRTRAAVQSSVKPCVHVIEPLLSAVKVSRMPFAAFVAETSHASSQTPDRCTVGRGAIGMRCGALPAARWLLLRNRCRRIGRDGGRTSAVRRGRALDPVPRCLVDRRILGLGRWASPVGAGSLGAAASRPFWAPIGLGATGAASGRY